MGLARRAECAHSDGDRYDFGESERVAKITQRQFDFEGLGEEKEAFLTRITRK